MMRVSVDDAASDQCALSVWGVYESVFGDYVGYDAWVEEMWSPHSGRDGFRLARAFDGDDLVALRGGEHRGGHRGARQRHWSQPPAVAVGWADARALPAHDQGESR